MDDNTIVRGGAGDGNVTFCEALWDALLPDNVTSSCCDTNLCNLAIETQPMALASALTLVTIAGLL